MIKNGKPIGESYKDNWSVAALENVVDDNGVVNWRAAYSADPGVCRCPKCDGWLWKEALKLECECGCRFNTSTHEVLQEEG